MPGKVISKTSADATMTQPVSALSMAVNGTISMHSPLLVCFDKEGSRFHASAMSICRCFMMDSSVLLPIKAFAPVS